MLDQIIYLIFRFFFLHLAFSDHSDEWCCCPCGKKLSSWRNMIKYGFDDGMRDLGEEPCDDKKYSPKGLLDHLSSKRNRGFLHWIVETYIRSLYKDYFKPGLDHKALYNINDANWRKAETMEMLDVNRYVTHIRIVFIFCYVTNNIFILLLEKSLSCKKNESNIGNERQSGKTILKSLKKTKKNLLIN